jgi:tRNA(Ile)-lysidine synthetase-like protein
LLAVSGGADSVALLRARHDLAPRRGWGLSLCVGHVQHHLRPEAEDEAMFVADLADGLGLAMLRVDLDPQRLRSAANLESAARRLRYRALHQMADQWGAHWVAVAHHADDQLETLLMRLLRGASVQGLSSMAWRRRMQREPMDRVESGHQLSSAPTPLPGLTLIRPMLAVNREEIRAYLQALDQPWREDPTNADPDRWRAHLRQTVLPGLFAMRPQAGRRAVALADHLRDVAGVLNEAIDRAAEGIEWERPDRRWPRAHAAGLRRPVLMGLLRRWLSGVGVPDDRLGTRQLAPLARAIRDGQGGPNGRRTFLFHGGVRAMLSRDSLWLESGYTCT